MLETCADLWGATDGFFDAYATGRLDPSGFVKGWAAQVASDRLLAAGAGNHCVNAGGDVRVRACRRPGSRGGSASGTLGGDGDLPGAERNRSGRGHVRRVRAGRHVLDPAGARPVGCVR
ncbi:FAD:protein FMN transferase [Micromonospora sp. M12]